MSRRRRSELPEHRAIDAARGPGLERVLIVLNDLATGGAQRVAVSQAAWLAADGYDVHVASLERLPAGAMIAECRRLGVPTHLLRGRGEPELLAAARLEALVRGIRPDVVHTHMAVAGVVGRGCARRHGVPHLVTTLHNLTDWQERAWHPLRFLDRKSLRWCDGIAAASEAIRAAMERWDAGLAARTRVVYNGVEVDSFARDAGSRATARESLGVEAAACVIGTVARLERRKGIDLLIGAFAAAHAAAPALRLLVVGDGPEREALAACARERGVERAVRFVGEQRDVRPWLAAMDVFAAPSRTEGLGIALIEAMAAGLPVLASRVGGIPEVIGSCLCGELLPPEAGSAWRDAMLKLAADPGARAALGATASLRARAFSVEASRDALCALYREVLGRAAKAA